MITTAWRSPGRAGIFAPWLRRLRRKQRSGCFCIVERASWRVLAFGGSRSGRLYHEITSQFQRYRGERPQLVLEDTLVCLYTHTAGEGMDGDDRAVQIGLFDVGDLVHDGDGVRAARRARRA